MAGWPMLPSADLYGGGPAYPLSALAARLQVRLTSNWTVLGRVLDDNAPGGNFCYDPQSEDAGGLRFSHNTGALFIAEAQLKESPIAGLPGSYKLGFSYDTGSFPTPAIDNQGISLVRPGSTYVAKIYHGNYSVYGVVDQSLRQSGGGARSVNAFARIMAALANRKPMLAWSTSQCSNAGTTTAWPRLLTGNSLLPPAGSRTGWHGENP